MAKALLVLLLFGIPTLFCFQRAWRTQTKWAVDGILKQPRAYLAMRLWLIAGAGFLVFGIIGFTAAIDPNFLPYVSGKR
jgi:hypothetical protein